MDRVRSQEGNVLAQTHSLKWKEERPRNVMANIGVASSMLRPGMQTGLLED